MYICVKSSLKKGIFLLMKPCDGDFAFSKAFILTGCIDLATWWNV